MRAAALCGFHDGRGERAIVDGCFIRPQNSRFDIFAERWFQLARVFGAERFGAKTHAVVYRDDGAKFRSHIAGEQRFERSFGPESARLPGNLFDRSDEIGIERKTCFANGHRCEHAGIFRSGRKNAGTGPGRFHSGRPGIEDGDAQTGAGELEGDGGADESATGDDGVEWLRRGHA